MGALCQYKRFQYPTNQRRASLIGRKQLKMSALNSPWSITYSRADLISLFGKVLEIRAPTRKTVRKIGNEDSDFFLRQIAKIVKHHTYGLENMFLGVIGVVEFDFEGFEIDFGSGLGVFIELYFSQAALTPNQTY